MNAKDIVIYSDMDGTMLTDWSMGPVVPHRNLVALKYFIESGGTFSIATGRQYPETMAFFPDIEINAPIVCGNGSNIYDPQSKRVIFKLPLPEVYKQQSLDYFYAHDDVWLVCADEFDVYQIMTGTDKDALLVDNFRRAKISVEEYLRREMTKVVYVSQKDGVMERIKKDVVRLNGAKLVKGLQSGASYYEMVDKKVSKADGVKRAVEYARLTNKKLVCMGDYLNDYDMLKAADVAVCPSNSAEQVKKICKFITCDNNQGAFADALEKLL